MQTRAFTLEFKGYKMLDELAQLPQASGVYCVYSCSYDSWLQRYEVKQLLYIGEADNLHKELSRVALQALWQKHLTMDQMLCFSFVEVAESDRFMVESALVTEHRPPLNEAYQERFVTENMVIFNSGKSHLLNSSFFLMGQ